MTIAGWRRILPVACVASLVLGACGGGGGGLTKGSGSDQTETSDLSDLTDQSDYTESNPTKTKFGPNDDDKIIKAAISEVEKFWKDEYPKLYNEPYQPLSGGEFPYGPDDPPPSCGGTGEAPYEEVAENAFYCPPGDFVAWDTENLTNQLLDDFGAFNLGIVVAHEMGHKIQGEHGILDGQFPTFVTEQQADCFAGAFTQHVFDKGSKVFKKVGSSDLDAALGGFLQIRDPVGTDYEADPSAHGSAFQRINAFEDGFTDGAERCKEYEDLNFTVVPEVFTQEEDVANEGNLPLADLEPAVVGNLDGFWTEAFKARNEEWTPATTNPFDPARGVKCDGDKFEGGDAEGLAVYCPDDDTINWDDAKLMPEVWENIGDLANATIIANLYSERVQHILGLPTGDKDANLQVDCFTGVWVGTTATSELNDRFPTEYQLTLSPGDLDEAVASFLHFGAGGEDDNTTGTPFQRLDAFRAGFITTFNGTYIDGLNTCLSGGGATAAESDNS